MQGDDKIVETNDMLHHPINESQKFVVSHNLNAISFRVPSTGYQSMDSNISHTMEV
jgi:hypothetical protein